MDNWNVEQIKNPNGEQLDALLARIFGKSWDMYWDLAFRWNPELLEFDRVPFGFCFRYPARQRGETKKTEAMVDIWTTS